MKMAITSDILPSEWSRSYFRGEGYSYAPYASYHMAGFSNWTMLSWSLAQYPTTISPLKWEKKGQQESIPSLVASGSSIIYCEYKMPFLRLPVRVRELILDFIEPIFDLCLSLKFDY